MDDLQILDLLWSRAEQAICEMASRFGPRLYRTAMNILGVHEDAEESVSDTYHAVWNAIPPKKPEPLAGFVYKTGRNIALSRLRDSTAKKRDGRYDLPLHELENTLAGPDLLDQISARELARQLNAFLNSQTAENRVMFLRRYWFGDSIIQIAKAFHLSENAVSVRLNRLRSKLKEQLKEDYYE